MSTVTGSGDIFWKLTYYKKRIKLMKRRIYIYKTYPLNACSRRIKMKGRFTFFIYPAITTLHFRKLAKSLLAFSTHPFPFLGGLKGNLL